MKSPLILVSASVALVLAILASLPLLNPNHQWPSWRSPVADLVVKNAKIYTIDQSLPFADSWPFATEGFSGLETTPRLLEDMVGYGTKELDLNGKIVVPGFIDSHVHLLSGGLQWETDDACRTTRHRFKG